MTYQEEFVNRIAVETAKLIAKEIKLDSEQIAILVAEILASDYKKRPDKVGSRDLLLTRAEEKLVEILQKDTLHA